MTSVCNDEVYFDLDHRSSRIRGWSPITLVALTMYESPSIVPDGIIKGSVYALFRPFRKARFLREAGSGARIFLKV